MPLIFFIWNMIQQAPVKSLWMVSSLEFTPSMPPSRPTVPTSGITSCG